MQGLRGRLHLRAQPTEERMQGLRGRLHLRAQPTEGEVLHPGVGIMESLQHTRGIKNQYTHIARA